MKWLAALLCLLLLFCAAQAEGDLTGVWCFAGGGEVMGMGFRLQADGTGEWLDTADTAHCPAKHLSPTGERFAWRMEGELFYADARSYPLSREDDWLHFASGDGGGFYMRFDADAVRAEIEEKRAKGAATQFDLLALDYLEDTLEETLAAELGLRSVNAAVVWGDAPSITVDAWQIAQDQSVWLQMTPDAVRAYAIDQPWRGMDEGDILETAVTVTPGADSSRVYYEQARYTLEKALQAAAADSLERLVADAQDGDFEKTLSGMGFEVRELQATDDVLRAELFWPAENSAFSVEANRYYLTVTLKSDEETPLNHQIYITQGENLYHWIRQAAESLVSWQRQNAESKTLAELDGKVLKFPKNKSYEVYRGPGKAYGRSADGKAKVSTGGDITCYGTWNGWLLVSYEISADKARFGWIDTKNLPESLLNVCGELAFTYNYTDYRTGVLTQSAALTDDPLRSRESVGGLPAGASVHCLATWQDWMLVEGFQQGKLIMGFVPSESVDRVHGYVADTRFEIENAVSWPEEEISAAMEAVRDCYARSGEGAHLLRVYYPEEENAPGNRWWRDKEAHPDIECMRLYADVEDISYYDFEISVDGVANELIVYCSRVPGGAWQGSLGGYE